MCCSSTYRERTVFHIEMGLARNLLPQLNCFPVVTNCYYQRCTVISHIAIRESKRLSILCQRRMEEVYLLENVLSVKENINEVFISFTGCERF